MSLETATTIAGLVATNPTNGDPKSQGDDHLRLIKAVLQAEFTPYSLGTSGYLPLPGGALVQWGTTSNSSGSAAVSVSFPKAFTTACDAIIMTAGAGADVNPTSESTSTSAFTFSAWSAGSRIAGYAAFYIAIGH